MCCFFCTTLRSVAYFMVSLHMIGTLLLFLQCAYTYFTFPPEGYPDLDINPLLVSNTPLLLAAYALGANSFSYLIFRGIDLDSVLLLKWSSIAFGGFQFIVIILHFIFTVMFVDILPKGLQAAMVLLLVVNFFWTALYLTVLFLHAKKLRLEKRGVSKLYRNFLNHQIETPNNNNNVSTTLSPEAADEACSTLRKKTNDGNTETNNPNLLESYETPVVPASPKPASVPVIHISTTMISNDDDDETPAE